MLDSGLFEQVLLAPSIKSHADTLYIVAGYATSAMAFHHLQRIKEAGRSVRINLIVGMCPLDGLAVSNHRGFLKISDDFSGTFSCSYVMKTPPVHAKTYAWFKGEAPMRGYVGSANYTQVAFGKQRREVMHECDSSEIRSYYDSLISDTIYCTHNDAENFIRISHDKYFKREGAKELGETASSDLLSLVPNLHDLNVVSISLLARDGTLPRRSGLNWGQRPEQNREPNQAYIKLPADICRTDFFPERTIHFTVLTDDNKVLVCTRAQDNGKAIQTPHNNSLIGEYFRHRLGLESGAPVTKDDLLRYGRADVDFYKIDSETYYMDFSVS